MAEGSKTHVLRQTIILFIIGFTLLEYIAYYGILVQFIISYKAQLAPLDLSILSILPILSVSLFFLMTYLIYWLTTSILLAMPALLLSSFKTLSWLSILSLIFTFWIWTLFINIDFYTFSIYQFHLSSFLIKTFLNKEIFQFLHLSSTEKNHLSFYAICSLAFISILFICCYKNYLKIDLKYGLRTYLSFWLLLCVWYLLNLFIHMAEKNIIHISQIDHFPGIKNTVGRVIEKLSFHNMESVSEHHSIFRIHNTKPLKKPKLSPNIPIPQNPYNVLWVMVDTLRADMNQPVDMPNLDQFSKKSIRFKQQYSSGNATIAGVFGMLYGIPANYFSSTIKHHTQPFLFDVLEKANYDFQIFWSGTLKAPPFDANAFSKRKAYEIHVNNHQGAFLDDEKSTHELIKFIKQPHGKPFFAFLNMVTVHDYCSNDSNRDLNPCNRLSLNNQTHPMRIKRHYLDAVHRVDGILKSLFDTLEHQEILNHTIVIITSDHGESFNEHKNNRWGHMSSYAPEVIHVPLIIHWPSKLPKEITYPTTHYDISTTLIEYLIQRQIPSTEYSIGQSLFDVHQKLILICGNYVNMAIINDNEILELHADGAIKLMNKRLMPLPMQLTAKRDILDAMSSMSRFYLND